MCLQCKHMKIQSNVKIDTSQRLKTVFLRISLNSKQKRVVFEKKKKIILVLSHDLFNLVTKIVICGILIKVVLLLLKVLLYSLYKLVCHQAK